MGTGKATRRAGAGRRGSGAADLVLEGRAQTVAALKIVLPRLLDAGYHFVTP